MTLTCDELAPRGRPASMWHLTGVFGRRRQQAPAKCPVSADKALCCTCKIGDSAPEQLQLSLTSVLLNPALDS